MKSVGELMSLRGRVALITGGAGHIGAAIGDALAEQGAAVAVLDLAPEACDRRAQAIQTTHGVRVLPLPIDLEDEAAVRLAPTRVAESFGRLDILVHCAALVGTSGLAGWTTRFEDQSAATWRRALEVNLTAAFVLTQACLPALSASGHGSVITIGSIYATLGPDMSLYAGTKMGNPAAYAASKGGLLQLTRWLATALAPGVRVNCISPGGVWRDQPEAFRARFVERTPLRRMATEEDLKGAAAYLASDLSAYVTGQNLVVDGGWSAW
jgi:NAD(P)-dependent dehydrogenase (short-subunit alcohol dehydrogenase family)